MKNITLTSLNSIIICLLIISCNLASAQTITFADNSLKTRLLQSNTNNGVARDINGTSMKIDANNDQQIQISEAQAVYQIKIEGGFIINNPGGIQYFTNLTHLTMTDIYLKSLNVTTMPNLKELDCHNNIMTVLTLGNHPQLEKLNCGFNDLAALNTSGLPSLKYFECNDNKLTALNVTQSTGLITLYCHVNQLTSLLVSGLQHLNLLDCSYNKLQNVSFDGLTNLVSLTMLQNLFHTINVEDCSQLNLFYVDFNPNLTSLYLKNGGPEENFSFHQTPNLQYICCDADEIDLYQYRVSFTNYNCTVDTSCALSTQLVASSHSKVYPNPVKDVLTFSGVNANSVTIYDLAGKIVMAQSIAAGDSQIVLSEIAQGYYIVSFDTQNGPVYHRIIKE